MSFGPYFSSFSHLKSVLCLALRCNYSSYTRSPKIAQKAIVYEQPIYTYAHIKTTEAYIIQPQSMKMQFHVQCMCTFELCVFGLVY